MPPDEPKASAPDHEPKASAPDPRAESVSAGPTSRKRQRRTTSRKRQRRTTSRKRQRRTPDGDTMATAEDYRETWYEDAMASREQALATVLGPEFSTKPSVQAC